MTLTFRVLYHFTSSALAGWLAWRLMEVMASICSDCSQVGDMASIYRWRLLTALFCAVWVHILFDIPEHGWSLPF